MFEQRKYRRVSCNSIFLYRLPNLSEEDRIHLMESETPLGVDLSEGGMKFIAIQSLPPGTKMTILLSIDNRIIPLILEAEVVWRSGPSNTGTYETGVEFRKMSDSDREILKNQLLKSS